jgi:DNA-directed RNA polymerase subunit RPC12/RpoP
MSSKSSPQRHLTNQDASRKRPVLKVEYLCHRCGGWYILSDYNLDEFMCKKCYEKLLKKENKS